MKYILSICFFFISLTSIPSCNRGNGSLTLSAQDKENLIEIQRFDKDLYEYLQSKTAESKDRLLAKYPDFLKAFGSVTINNSEPAADYFSTLEQYFSNPMLSQIYKDALATFNNIESYQKQLSEANELIKEYFDGKKLPVLSMHVSGFKSNTIVLDNLISISTDKYLGKDYAGYKQFFDEYQLVQMQPEMVVRDYLKAWVMGEIPTDNKRKDLLSEMINEGKVLYALQQLLPEWNEADLIGYTPSQLEWTTENEKKVWKATVSQNYLFSTDHMTIIKYMDEAPYTSLISTESPGRLGAWLGWQIVNKYAENSKKDLATILNETDYQSILKASKYNP